MTADIIIGGAIFGYASFCLFRFIRKSKEGKCAGCGLKDSCKSKCE